MKITVLGCGGSEGVPGIHSGWGRCNPSNMRNYRTRTSLFLETDKGSRILVDTAPEFRYQYLINKLDMIDAVFFTHIHTDHTQGIPDLRSLFIREKKTIDIYADENTVTNLLKAYEFLFHEDTGYYPVALYYHVFERGNSVKIANDDVQTLDISHGEFLHTAGLRIGDFAYIPDFLTLSEENYRALEGVKTLVISTAFISQTLTHAAFDAVVECVNHIKPEKAYLVHMSAELDYDYVLNSTPDNVFPTYDGMIIEA